MDWSYNSSLGKLLRLPFRLIPDTCVLPVFFGYLRGARWIKGSGVNGYWLGVYERHKAALFYRNIKPGRTVFDVGAHVGYYSLLAARAVGAAGRVIAFEPLPRNLEFLRKHKELNRVANLEIAPVAVGEKTGEAQFVEGPSTTTGRVGEGGLSINMVDLDSFARQRNLEPAVIKIDVEGSGAAVVKGAKSIISMFRPLIFFAMHNAEERQALQGLRRLGYKLEGLDGDLDAASEAIAYP